MNYRLIIWTLLFFNSTGVYADNQILINHLKNYGISEQSKFYAVYVNKQNNQSVFGSNEINNEVIKHLRSTKGIAFTEVKEKPADTKPHPLTDREKEAQKSAYRFAYNNPDKYKILPRCEKDITEKTPSGRQVNMNEAKFEFFDMLFIKPEDLPLDPELAFGPHVQIIQYGNNPQSARNVAVNGVKVPCLPYRVRSTPAFLFKHQGLNALKNYESDPNGNGVLTDIEKVKLKNR